MLFLSPRARTTAKQHGGIPGGDDCPGQPIRFARTFSFLGSDAASQSRLAFCRASRSGLETQVKPKSRLLNIQAVARTIRSSVRHHSGLICAVRHINRITVSAMVVVMVPLVVMSVMTVMTMAVAMMLTVGAMCLRTTCQPAT